MPKTDPSQTWTDDPEPRPETAERLPGERYELRRELGRGAMGRVVLAWDLVLEREVAVKLLVAGRGRAVFLREARIAARLEHPAIVPVHDAGITTEGDAFYVMRLVPGTHLGDAVARATPAARLDLLDAVIDVARAVAYAHELGVVHRDLKPENVMLGPRGEVQVVDWGLARVLQEAEPQLRAWSEDPEAGRVVGTPAYMSPEQASGLPADARADVWALGMILREVLTGEQPWNRTTSPELVMTAVRKGQAPPLPPDLPAELGAVVRRATAKTPSDRYAHAGAFVEDLLAFRNGRRVSAHTYSAWEAWQLFDRQFWWPVRAGAVGVVAGAVALGVVTDQYRAARRAEGAERQANVDLSAAHQRLGDALTRSLLQGALDADREGRGTEALVWASAALERAPADPVARGITGRWMSSLPVQMEADLGEVPGPCNNLLRGAGNEVLCSGPAGTWSWDGGVRWHRPELMASALARDALHVVVPDAAKALVLDAKTGATLFELPETRVAAVVGDDVYRVLLTRVERWSVATGQVVAGIDLTSQGVTLSVTDDEVVVWTASGVVYHLDRGLAQTSSTTIMPRRAVALVSPSAGDLAIVGHPDAGASFLSRTTWTTRPLARFDWVLTGMGISATGDRAFVSDPRGFWLVDPVQGASLASFPGGGSTDLLFGDHGGIEFVAQTRLRTLTANPSVTSYPQPGGVRDVWPAGEGRAYVNSSGGRAQVFDVSDGAVVDQALVPGTFGAPSVVWLGPGQWVAATTKGLRTGDGERWQGEESDGVRSVAPWGSGFAALRKGQVAFVENGSDLRVAVPEQMRELWAGMGERLLVSDGRGDYRWVTPAGLDPGSAIPIAGALPAGGPGCGFWWAQGTTLVRTGPDPATVHLAILLRDPRIRSACTVGPDAVAVAVSETVRILRISTGEELAQIGPLQSRISATTVVGEWLLLGMWKDSVERWWLPALDLPGATLAAMARRRTGWTAADGVLAPVVQDSIGTVSEAP